MLLNAAKILIASLAAAFFVYAPATAQNNPAEPKLTIRASGDRLVIKSPKRSYTIDVAGKIDAARVEDVSILFVTRRADFIYLLVDVCGLSKVPPDDRMCGAGIECNLLWLKLDSRFRLVDSNSAHYESCWQPITATDGYKIDGRILRMEYSDLNENLKYKLDYDADQPERGFQIEKSPLEQSGSR